MRELVWLERNLVGFGNRLKAEDRVKDKIAESLAVKGHSVADAMKLIPDAIRYAFQYHEADYSRHLIEDMALIEERFSDLVRLKNFWRGDQYKGISSAWRHRGTGQLFEIQFHTEISFHAMTVITGPSYARLRSAQTCALEEIELEAFQREVYSYVPVPPAANAIFGYPDRDDWQIPGMRKTPERDITYYAIVDDLSSREQPVSVLRRSYLDGGRRDEAFTRDLVWRRSALLISAERGDLENEFFEITADEVNQIMDRVRHPVGNEPAKDPEAGRV